MTNKNEIKLFQNRQIRTKWDSEIEDYYFSVIDVIAVLTESKNPSQYWRTLKSRLKEEGGESVTNCNRLKMPAADGKLRLTDVATTKQLLRIIQSVPSPKAEPFKQWLAQLVKDVSLTMKMMHGFIIHICFWKKTKRNSKVVLIIKLLLMKLQNLKK